MENPVESTKKLMEIVQQGLRIQDQYENEFYFCILAIHDKKLKIIRSDIYNSIKESEILKVRSDKRFLYWKLYIIPERN